MELVLIAPALLALLTMTVLAGRVVLAGGTVEQVAAAGARAASLARTPAAAAAAADTAARRAIGEQHLQCTTVAVAVDTSGFGVPLGQPATVAVEVSCQVQLADLTVPGLPGSRTLSERAVSPLDPYRGRASALSQPALPPPPALPATAPHDGSPGHVARARSAVVPSGPSRHGRTPSVGKPGRRRAGPTRHPVPSDRTGDRAGLLGQPASIQIDVSGRVRPADLSPSDPPGSRLVADQAGRPLRPYRRRTG